MLHLDQFITLHYIRLIEPNLGHFGTIVTSCPIVTLLVTSCNHDFRPKYNDNILHFPSSRLEEEVKLSVFHHLLFREARWQRLSAPPPPQGQGSFRRRRRWRVHRRKRRRRQRFRQQQPVLGGRRGRRRRSHRKRGGERAQVRRRGNRGLIVGRNEGFITGEFIGYTPAAPCI